MDLTPFILKGMSWINYLDLIRDLLSTGKTTGPNQNEDLLHYTNLNLHRMERIEKTIVIDPKLVDLIKNIDEPQSWLVLTEAWCGDAAQNLPLFYKLSELNPLITLRFVLRDENLTLMDKFLTNGARAIPIVIAFQDNKTLWKWGPRPASLQQTVIAFKNQPTFTHEELKTHLHTWYAKNKTLDQQAELLEILSN